EERRLEDREPPLRGRPADEGVAGEIGLVEQSAGPERRETHQADERGEVADLGEIAEVALNVGLDIALEPQMAILVAGGERSRRQTSLERRVPPVEGPGRRQ